MKSRSRRRSGYTLVEATITISLFTIVMGGFVTAVHRFRDVVGQAESDYVIREKGLRALAEMSQELERSGFVDLAMVSYPVVFDDGSPAAAFDAFSHSPPHCDNADAVHRELIFRCPEDADGDGWPDLDVNGNVVWSDELVAFVLLPQDDGTNHLCRMTGDGTTTLVAEDVEELTFDDPSSSGHTIPLNCVRIRIRLNRQKGGGRASTFESECIVQLKNGGLAS